MMCKDCIFFKKKNGFIGMCSKHIKLVKNKNICDDFNIEVQDELIIAEKNEVKKVKFSKIIIRNGKKEYIE